jgi:CHAT domain-containing protein
VDGARRGHGPADGDFYRAYAAGQTAPEALRQAQMARMQVSPHPSAWGGFVLLDRP